MFPGALASGARAHIQDMESHMAGLAGIQRGAATCAHTRGLGRSSSPERPHMARHGGGVGEFLLFDPFLSYFSSIQSIVIV